MRVNLSRDSIMVQQAVRTSQQGLYTSMNRLSTGQKVSDPGDAPADYGISQSLRYQIRNSQEAARNLEKASSLINTADAWMQSVQDMLSRMQEIAISAQDSAKADADRASLNTEYLQLKEEIGRIAREAKYNGLQVAGRDQLLSYDQDKETFVFSQLDGGESYDLNVKVLSGLKTSNSLDFLFDSSKDFVQSHDGKYVYYVDSNDNLARYDINEGELRRDTADSESKGLDVDDLGRLWYATETSSGSGTYALRQQNKDTWAQDTTLIGNTDLTDMASTEFKIFDNRVYYVNTSSDLVSRELSNLGDLKVELDASDQSFSTTAGQFAISEDGLFMADMTNATTLRITNLESKLTNTYQVDSSVTVSALTFSADNRDLMYVDSATGTIHSLELQAEDQPALTNASVIHNPSGSSGFVGLSLDGGSHRAHFRVHSGPDAAQESFLTMGDARLLTLGISRTKVDSVEGARDALGRLQEATNRVSVQRARLGGEQSRMMQSYEALRRYADQVEVADSVLRDVNVAEETARMTDYQVRYQMSLAMVTQASQTRSNMLQLLQR